MSIGDIGYTFRKQFDVGWYTGKVITIWPEAAKGKDRRCQYNDGDEEDLSLRELQILAKLESAPPEKKPTRKSSRSRNGNKTNIKSFVAGTPHANGGDDPVTSTPKEGTSEAPPANDRMRAAEGLAGLQSSATPRPEEAVTDASQTVGDLMRIPGTETKEADTRKDMEGDAVLFKMKGAPDPRLCCIEYYPEGSGAQEVMVEGKPALGAAGSTETVTPKLIVPRGSVNYEIEGC